MATFKVSLINDSDLNTLWTATLNLPNQCPACKAIIHPIYLHGAINIEAKTFYGILECRACHRPFIMVATAERDLSTSGQTKGIYNISKDAVYLPDIPEKRAFSEHITNTSPQFVRIFNQALASESYHLDEIAGAGYRKALEFLIKDYLCIGKNDDEKQRIIKKRLGKLIEDDVTEQNIKEVAKRAVWLGNDEVHYYRKWEALDIAYLKKLINLTVNWIENVLDTRECIQEMPDDRK